MGCKESKPTLRRVTTRAETLKPIWELSVSVASSSKDSYASESRESGWKTNVATRLKSKSARRLPTEVVKIDVKSAKKHFTPMDSQKAPRHNHLSLNKREAPESKRQASEPIAHILMKKTSRIAKIDFHPGFEETDFTPNLFLGRHDDRYASKDSYKALRSNYKLIRPNQRPASLDFNSAGTVTIGKGTLIKFMNEALEEKSNVPMQKRVQIKHLGTATNTLNTPNSPLRGGFSAVAKGLDGERKGKYLIKTAQTMKFGQRTIRSAVKDDKEEKSRAERIWAWRGKRGSLLETMSKTISD